MSLSSIKFTCHCRWLVAKTKVFSQITLARLSGEIAGKLLKKLSNVYAFDRCSLEYLVDRVKTLSGGEAQRIRLASQIRSGLWVLCIF